MTKIAQITIVFALFISLALNLFQYNQTISQNTVTEVVDGDTFQLKSGKRVRLLGVDAPEFNRCGGKEAKYLLQSLIFGKIVILKEETDDAYGRTQALVYAKNSFINKIILESGWARTDYRKNSQREQLTAAFHSAQQQKKGIFSNLCRIQASEPADSECVIKGNIDLATGEKIFHLPDCRYYQEIILDLDRGEQFFCSEEEAQSSGFRKASSCP